MFLATRKSLYKGGVVFGMSWLIHFILYVNENFKIFAPFKIGASGVQASLLIRLVFLPAQTSACTSCVDREHLSSREFLFPCQPCTEAASEVPLSASLDQKVSIADTEQNLISVFPEASSCSKALLCC